MKTNNSQVNQMFMNIVTAAIFTFAFTACSDDLDSMDSRQMATDDTKEKVSGGVLLDPIALNYFDFNTSGDVQILTPDTTQISVSKALADKMGVNSFVDHPMGVWEGEHIRPYHVRATKQVLMGDRYILDVVQAGIAEFVPEGQDLELSTEFYMNNDAPLTRGVGSMASAYTDADGVIHPAGVHLFHRPEVPGEGMTRGIDSCPMEYYSAEQILGLDNTRGLKNGTYCDVNKDASIIKVKNTFKRDAKFGANNDTINVHVKVPIDFSLNCKFRLYIARRNFVVPKVEDVEAGVYGKFAFSPEFIMGFEKNVNLANKQVNLVDFTAYSFTFWIGPILFWVDVNPNLYMKFKADVYGKFYGGFKYEYENNFKAGAKYSGGWSTYKSSNVTKNDFTFITPTGTFGAEAESGLFLGVNLIIDKLAGPKISVGPKITAKAEMSFAPLDTKKPLAFEASLKAGVSADVGMKVKLWKIDIADWSQEITLVDAKTLWKYNYPQDMENKKDDPVTKVLDKATETIKKTQEEAKKAITGK